MKLCGQMPIQEVLQCETSKGVGEVLGEEEAPQRCAFRVQARAHSQPRPREVWRVKDTE